MSPYSTRYYEGIKEDSAASAKSVVPLLLQLFPSKTVIDVGCGSGTWAKVYLDAGCDVLGIDGHVVRPEQLLIPAQRFERHNLNHTLSLNRCFDLVNCLEVAEHLDPARGPSFVADLCRLGDVVIFSAAVPGQGGTHHVNEQWPSYWIPHFQSAGFAPLDCVRWQIWNRTEVAWWYVQNIFAFVKESRVTDFPKACGAVQLMPTDVVHPRAYVRATVPAQMSPRMLKEVVKALPYFPGQVMAHFRK